VTDGAWISVILDRAGRRIKYLEIMATTSVLVPVEEYLATAYHPDVDYVDGRLEDRNVGKKSHGKLQFHMTALLKNKGLAAFMETRVQISATHYRVPDVCVYEKEPDEEVFTAPPLVCIEVLSPEDRLSRVMNGIEDYREMGVPAVWVLDPLDRKSYLWEQAGGLREVTDGFTIGEVAVTVAEIFP
jgi:Uma2 family endonuclease